MGCLLFPRAPDVTRVARGPMPRVLSFGSASVAHGTLFVEPALVLFARAGFPTAHVRLWKSCIAGREVFAGICKAEP